jgi:DNA repair protein RecO (recombination protein O)
MKLIILNINPYKEKDAIILAFNNEGSVTFNARGILNAKSKNVILNNPLIEAEIIFSEGKSKHHSLKNASLIFSPYTANDSLEKLSVISIIQECTYKILQEEELPLIYSELIKVLKALKEGKIHPYQILITYIMQVLKIAGTSFEVNECIYCSTKNNIVDFSFIDGGFVCKDCIIDPTNKYFSSNQMFLIRSLILFNNYEQQSKYFNIDDALIILDKLISFIYDGVGVKIKSFELLKS